MKDPELKFWTSPPNGFLVATNTYDDKVIGCIAYKKNSDSTLELNRLVVNIGIEPYYIDCIYY
jgi:hypothetical protein